MQSASRLRRIMDTPPTFPTKTSQSLHRKTQNVIRPGGGVLPLLGVVEVAQSWFNRSCRLLIRWEKLADNYLGFVELAACLIIWRKLASLSG